MKKTNYVAVSKLWSAVLCGVLSLIADFILLPHMFTLITVLGFPIPDPIWMPLMILIPVIIAIYILERKAHIPAKYVWVGLPVQYLILIIFASPIYRISPLASDEWTYIGAAIVWPFGIATAQFIALIALRTWKSKRNK